MIADILRRSSRRLGSDRERRTPCNPKKFFPREFKFSLPRVFLASRSLRRLTLNEADAIRPVLPVPPDVVGETGAVADARLSRRREARDRDFRLRRVRRRIGLRFHRRASLSREIPNRLPIFGRTWIVRRLHRRRSIRSEPSTPAAKLQPLRSIVWTHESFRRRRRHTELSSRVNDRFSEPPPSSNNRLSLLRKLEETLHRRRRKPLIGRQTVATVPINLSLLPRSGKRRGRRRRQEPFFSDPASNLRRIVPVRTSRILEDERPKTRNGRSERLPVMETIDVIREREKTRRDVPMHLVVRRKTDFEMIDHRGGIRDAKLHGNRTELENVEMVVKPTITILVPPNIFRRLERWSTMFVGISTDTIVIGRMIGIAAIPAVGTRFSSRRSVGGTRRPGMIHGRGMVRASSMGSCLVRRRHPARIIPIITATTSSTGEAWSTSMACRMSARRSTILKP